LNLVELSEFERAHRSFLMYDPDSWLLDQLLAEGSTVTILANWPHGLLYEVTVRQ
jgi:hypothetical protein